MQQVETDTSIYCNAQINEKQAPHATCTLAMAIVYETPQSLSLGLDMSEPLTETGIRYQQTFHRHVSYVCGQSCEQEEAPH